MGTKIEMLKAGAGVLLLWVWLSLLPSKWIWADASDIVVMSPWARASIGSQPLGAAYMTLSNKGEEAVALINVEADIAMMAEMHQTTINAQGIVSMSPLKSIEIPAGSMVKLAPLGFHIMLTKLTRPMEEGATFLITLHFSNESRLAVYVPVLSPRAREPED